eukprot:GFYU01002977.1.p1 GENE.GFYU01002977.1~~GFYU01002977.1.p1  ORF type:complete len:488 (-),score=150.75 GFYU01002977.1:180-1643(-)
MRRAVSAKNVVATYTLATPHTALNVAATRTLGASVATYSTEVPLDNLVTFCEGMKAGDFTPQDALDATLTTIKARNPPLNAITELRREVKREVADVTSGNGKLKGVPVLVKDSVDIKGMKTTLGSPMLRDGLAGNIFKNPKKKNAPLIDALQAEGALIVGKTNLPEKGVDVQTFNEMWGTTNNPYDTSLTPAGSSGGSAVSVAAGMVPLAIGSDLAGSLRIPAAYNGLSTIRSSPGRVSMEGHTPPGMQTGSESESSLTFGPLVRDVASIELFMEAIAGHPGMLESYNKCVTPEASSVKVAITSAFPKIETDVEIVDTLESKLPAALRAGSVNVENIQCPEFDFRNIGKAYFMYASRLFIEHGASSPEVLAKADKIRDAAREEMDRVLEKYDVWVHPAAAALPFPHNPKQRKVSINGQMVPYWNATLPYVTLGTVTSHPIMVIPLGMSKEGLPIGAQFVGRKGEDEKLLAIGRLFESLVEGCPPPQL